MAEYIYGFSAKQEIFHFEIVMAGESFNLNGFYDTGFRVKDILTHKAVMLCSIDCMADRLPESFVRSLKTFSDCGKTTPVFYSDLSSEGILPAVKPDKVMYKNREIKNVLLAFTETKLAEDVQLIFGKEIFNMTGE